jgi:hypothetical protein
MGIELDHIVIGAATLEDGVRFVRERLGVEIPPGGKHPLMGTHNHVMRVGPASFLEVIAIDPAAPPPGRPRWFGLDDPAVQRGLEEQPRLIAWVARTADIDALVEASPVPLGEITSVTRGSLSWRLTVPADGRPVMDGLAPHLIAWDGYLQPWDAMADAGCRLKKLTLAHPEIEKLQSVLQVLGLAGREWLTLERAVTPILSVAIETPSGVAQI